MEEWKKAAMPCPFCGGSDLEIKEDGIWTGSIEEYRVQVVCKSCGAAGPRKKWLHDDMMKSLRGPSYYHEVAVIEWNKAKR